jgi:hypothetical protein
VVEFSGKFANLERVVIKDRHLNLKGEILRHGWNEAQWNQKSRLRQESWDAECTFVEEVFKERGIELVTLKDIPEAEGTRIAFMATFPARHISTPKVKGREE